MAELHVLLPNDIDDPAAPSGGNSYDRRLCAGLAELGRPVREHPVRGGWPRPDAADRARLRGVLAALPPGAMVLVDGLIASAVPDVLRPEADRLRLVVLVHLPLEGAAERAALEAAAAVVTTSGWTRRRLIERHGLPADRIHVATPGVDPAPLAAGTASGANLLCVGAVTPEKGQDVLAGAVGRLPASCRVTLAGPLDRDPGLVAAVRGAAPGIRLTGPLGAARLAAEYAAADLLLLPSRVESYGMVVTEALARGIPVLASDVGGVPEALGRAPDGSRPGLLVPAGDPAGLAAAMLRWLGDTGLRDGLRASARGRRATLTGWDVTARRVAAVLDGGGRPRPAHRG